MKIKKLATKLAVAAMVLSLVTPLGANAAQITSRSATMSTSAGGATASYTVNFTLGTSGQTLGAVKFELCDSPVATTACAGTGNSSGASFGSATFGSVTGLAGSWSANAGTAGSASGTSIVFKKATPGVESGTPAATVIINGVVNPTANNKEFYLRISTYTDVAATSPVYPGTDYGVVALSTAQQITVNGTMPESLVFCVGTSGTGCGDMTGNTVNLGTFSPTSTNTGTSLMSASTNASSGYAITLAGTTLASGANSIPAMGTQSANSAGCSPSCTSTTGTSQFGTNVRANTTPAVGANVSGSGTGAAFSGYATANSFRFFTGDTVATATGPTQANLYTNSYIVNVGGDQAAGNYTATLTYVCTATF